MKVDKNQIFPNIELFQDSVGVFGIPVRLEIASRLLAGRIARASLQRTEHPDSPIPKFELKVYLEIADDLIAAHNESEGWE